MVRWTAATQNIDEINKNRVIYSVSSAGPHTNLKYAMYKYVSAHKCESLLIQVYTL